jgi:hypothetical protein
MSASVTEYVTNMRQLLGADRAKFGIMVERQVQFRLLPQVQGHRAALEPQLWDLLVFCLDGHDAPVPRLDDAAYARAAEAVKGAQALAGGRAAAWPRAASAVLAALQALRETGIYPPPKLR